ncbi:TolC family protein [Neolewinella aurantiaca]|uniref:TolC family protein n=1 Tax=Neolewinella aurantiaca TaxID=2602767 RepID=A0A5C7FIH0_9BACT|nr:TolC family protein [Neolewinella aurantiaca]TXF91022.1 TolC family protein [Neolewinella aurantiaca]
MSKETSQNERRYSYGSGTRLARRSALWLVAYLGFAISLFAQAPLRVTLLSDLDTASDMSLDNLISDEVEALLGSRYDLTIETLYTGGRAADIAALIDRAYAESDFVIGSGLTTSSALAARGTYPKPTIASIVLDTPDQSEEAQDSGGDAGAERPSAKGTGITNFTFVESPFDIGRDLSALREIADYERLTVITTRHLRPALASVINEVAETPVDYIEATGSVPEILRQIPPAARAAYFSPLEGILDSLQQTILLDSLAQRGTATFGLLDRPFLDLGVLAAYSSSENLSKIPRRIALDVLRIMDGIPASELNTELVTFNSGLIINMATAREAGIYPSWKTMREAVILNPNELPDARILTLEAAILEGLANNLGYELSKYDVALADTDVGIARSNLLPQLDVATTMYTIDKTTVASSFGQQGTVNWTANASLSQVILSEPALANVAINELLLEGQRAALQTSQLDVVLDVITAYLNTLQAKVFADLQNENLAVTRANLDAAGAKQEAGAVGVADVYRWESELALNRIEVNNATAQLAQARYNLNQILNRPTGEEFQLPAFQGQDTLLGIVGLTMLPLLNNQRDLDRFALFLKAEAKRNLPTLRQLDAAIKAQERQLLSAKRAFYLPTVALAGEYDYRIANYGAAELPPEFADLVGGADRPRGTYNVAINASFPIFQGGARKFQAEKAKVATLQAQAQRQDVENQLMQRLYSSIETVVASYRNLQLARNAAATASKNFGIVEDLYRAGATNITSLVDAQNVTLQSEINATNAGYQFVADFAALQRSTGSYQFLAGEAEQLEFVKRFMEFSPESSADDER